MTQPLKETRFVKELAAARLPATGSKKTSAAIERILVKKGKLLMIRFSGWEGKRMMPRPLVVSEEDLLPLLTAAIEAEVFSAEFTGGLKRALAVSGATAAEGLPSDAPEVRRVEVHFHDLIRSRAGEAVREHNLTLPELRLGEGSQDDPLWFAIEGMHGGFKYWWDPSAKRLRLMTESWSRTTAGSGQLHEVTAAGARLLGEGFV